MVHMTQLPFDILNLILILVATPSDGARDLARVAITCKTIMKQVIESVDVLRAVNFQSLTFNEEDFRMHRHRKGLLCMCARAGNQAAQSTLGKALLIRDPWFWGMVFGDSLVEYHCGTPPTNALHHHKLVRTFILHATLQDVASMYQPLVNYVITFVGYNAARESGVLCGFYDMCSYKVARLRTTRMRGSFANVVVWLEPLYEEEFNRENVIVLFDELFSLASD